MNHGERVERELIRGTGAKDLVGVRSWSPLKPRTLQCLQLMAFCCGTRWQQVYRLNMQDRFFSVQKAGMAFYMAVHPVRYLLGMCPHSSFTLDMALHIPNKLHWVLISSSYVFVRTDTLTDKTTNNTWRSGNNSCLFVTVQWHNDIIAMKFSMGIHNKTPYKTYI